MTDRLLNDEEIKELPVPDEIKKLISGITQTFHMAVRELAGNIELAYWRGKQEDDQTQDIKTLKAVGEWLDKRPTAIYDEGGYWHVLMQEKDIDQLKQGKMPEE